MSELEPLLIEGRQTLAGMWEWRMSCDGIVVRVGDHPHITKWAMMLEANHILGMISGWTEAAAQDTAADRWRTMASSALPERHQLVAGAQVPSLTSAPSGRGDRSLDKTWAHTLHPDNINRGTE